MSIIVRGRNIEITPALREYVEKRIGKVTKYFDTLGEITVILTVAKDDHVVEVTVPVNGMLLRGEENTNDMYTSIDLVVEKIERQVRKYKTKIARRLRSGMFKGELISNGDEKPSIDEFKVVKTKKFAIKPMNVEEAILQMKLLHHDFFVFLNGDTEEVNVVYCRKDGNFGLIEPEF